MDNFGCRIYDDELFASLTTVCSQISQMTQIENLIMHALIRAIPCNPRLNDSSRAGVRKKEGLQQLQPSFYLFSLF